MRFIYVGDVVGRAGRAAVASRVPELRQRLELDAVVVNGENAAAGYGLTAQIAADFFSAGVDIITLGNHAWDQRELVQTIDRESRIVRPLNMASGTPGRGAQLIKTARGKRLLVVQVLGRLFMGLFDDPFRALETELQSWQLGGNVDAILVDVHAEATSEQMALGHFCDGRVSQVAGTNTHVPTADAHILVGGTGYITDLGMTGDYDSVIGMDKSGSIVRWRTDTPTRRLEPATAEATLCGVLVDTDVRTGLATRIVPIREGGRLQVSSPSA